MADDRFYAVFLRPYAKCLLYGRALAGVRLRTPVSTDAGLSTLPCARPPRLTAGRRVRQPVPWRSSMTCPIRARFERYQRFEKLSSIGAPLHLSSRTWTAAGTTKRDALRTMSEVGGREG